MSGKDWVGNASVRNCNLRTRDAEPNDYYATEPKAVELLLENEQFGSCVLEPACGEGHISEVLKGHGYDVISCDLIDRGYGNGGVDFLTNKAKDMDVDIITNPPYKYAKEFVEKALEVVADGRKVAMFLKLTFLEGKGRRDLFRNAPPENRLCQFGKIAMRKEWRFLRDFYGGLCLVCLGERVSRDNGYQVD